MVNTGKPSRACHLCRTRRVKCDEQRPQCKRCITFGKPCPGYREETVFRDQSSWAQGAVGLRIAERDGYANQDSSPTSKPRTPALPISLITIDSGSNDETISAISTRARNGAKKVHLVTGGAGGGKETRDTQPIRHGNSKSHVQTPPLSPTPTDMQVDLIHIPSPVSFDFPPEVYAIAQFYSQYVVATGFLRVLDFLPGMPVDRLPCIRDATPALAFASVARQTRRFDLMVEARRHYGRALKSVNEALVDKKKAKSDCVFVAVFLLGIYELITGEKPKGVEWAAHLDGLRMLLDLRSENTDHSRESTIMLPSVASQLLINSFVTRTRFSPLLSQYAMVMDTTHPIANVGTVFVMANGLFLDFCELLDSKVAMSPEEEIREILNLLQRSVEINRKWDAWAASLPPSWTPVLIPNLEVEDPLCPGRDGRDLGSICFCDTHPPVNLALYPDIDTVGTWIVYGAIRIELSNITLRAVSRLTALSFTTPITALFHLSPAPKQSGHVSSPPSLDVSLSDIITSNITAIRAACNIICSALPPIVPGHLNSRPFSSSSSPSSPFSCSPYTTPPGSSSSSPFTIPSTPGTTSSPRSYSYFPPISSTMPTGISSYMFMYPLRCVLMANGYQPDISISDRNNASHLNINGTSKSNINSADGNAVIDVKLKVWTRSKLTTIGRELGIGQFLILAGEEPGIWDEAGREKTTVESKVGVADLRLGKRMQTIEPSEAIKQITSSAGAAQSSAGTGMDYLNTSVDTSSDLHADSSNLDILNALDVLDCGPVGLEGLGGFVGGYVYGDEATLAPFVI